MDKKVVKAELISKRVMLIVVFCGLLSCKLLGKNSITDDALLREIVTGKQ